MASANHQPVPIAEAVELAVGLTDQYGEYALIGAKAALSAMSRMRSAEGIDLWSEVCAVLATDSAIRFRV